MDTNSFGQHSPGRLIPISGVDRSQGEWSHYAFLPDPLSATSPTLSTKSYLAVAQARAELAKLDATAQQLPNPTLLRMPTLRKEAQSTSALEGTYVPIDEILAADEDAPHGELQLEVMNYVRMAKLGFKTQAAGYPLSIGLLEDLQGELMRGTRLEAESGKIRERQVVIGTKPGIQIKDSVAADARFVPLPPGPQLQNELQNWRQWVETDHSQEIDPVVATAMAHYQFETLHPFRDGNGRLGRFLIVLHLQKWGLLSEPTLTVSPWFEAKRTEYYDALFGVSASGDWDHYIHFFSTVLAQAALHTRNQMNDLVAVQAELKDRLRAAQIKSETAFSLVDLAVANPNFTAAQAKETLGISYAGTNRALHQLSELGILQIVDPNAYKRRFYAPNIIKVLTQN